MKESLSLFVGCRWCSKYFWTASSVILPVDQAPYPVDQKYRPQYCSRRWGNYCCSSLDERPLRRLLISAKAIFGGYSMCIWTWSLDTTLFKIRTSSASQLELSIPDIAVWCRLEEHGNNTLLPTQYAQLNDLSYASLSGSLSPFAFLKIIKWKSCKKLQDFYLRVSVNKFTNDHNLFFCLK